MIDLDELMKLRDAATPGPWKSHPMGTNDTFHLRISKYYPETEWVKNTAFVFHKNCISSYADAEYICAACNAVPELVARIRELEEQVSKQSLKQFSALEPCRIVSNNNSTPSEWLMRKFTEVK